MASIAASSSSSSSAQQQWRYDVFLSFRGEDTRNNFTSHLYKELLHKGIVTFKDDRELRKGGSVPLQLPKAIQDSRILVVIFSKNYANSTWCLNELVKIFECKKGGRQIVLPIFYDVSPSEVRKQTGKFVAPFAAYEKDKIERLQQWRVASTEVANLSGWDLNDRDEAEFIQDIVDDILRQLRRSSRSIAKDFVGMEPRLKEMNDYLDLGQVNKVRIIGICGLGGIGKTTIASVVYNDIYCKFEGYCFLGDVRESFEKDGAVSLQNKLLSAIMDKGIQIHDVYTGSNEIRNRLHRKRILVILDDVDQLKQIELLIGKRDEYWFGIGSTVIITTRDEHLLKQHGVDVIYKVDGLNYDDSLKLFCSKACRNTYLEEEYLKLCNEFVKYASGLPLALDILGSCLCGKSLEVWNSTLNRLKEIPNEKVLGKLELSYVGLDQISKQIFLDIAGFFRGMKEKYVVKILESCRLFPDSGIGELIDKSLITISDSGYVQMHDLVREMGREIVRRESYEDPGLRSRIWLDHNVYVIQVNSMEAKHVKAIVLRSWKQEEKLSAKIFSKVKELRLLILQNIPVSQDIEYLSNKLMYLEWHKCPCKFFPSSFQPENLVRLNMQSSNMEQLWKTSIRPIKSLTVINLSFSKNLIKTPNFREVPNLEKLNLERCESLREVHQSIGVLKRLVLLNLKYCVNLVALPDSMSNLKSLKTLILRGCSKLIKLAEGLGDLTSLVEIDAAEMGVQQMELANRWDFRLRSWLTPWTWKNPNPMAMVFSSLSTLPFLEKLNLSYCNIPEGSVSSLSALPFLKKLNLSYCNIPEGSIPTDLSGFLSLEYLELRGSNIVSLPSSVSHLSKLNRLEVSDCRRLQSLPDLPSSLDFLIAHNCISLETLPNLFDKYNPNGLSLVCTNCSKLKDCKRNISAALALLRSCLISFLKLRQQGRNPSNKLFQKTRNDFYPYPDPIFSSYFPGNEIPELFTYQSVTSSLGIRLASCEKWGNIAGFMFCFLFPPCSGKVVKCEFTAYSKNREIGRYVGGNCFFISDYTILKSEHLHLSFLPNYLLDIYEEESPTEFLLFTFGKNVKKCRIRIVHEKEIQELMESNKPLENVDPEESASGSLLWRSYNPLGEEEGSRGWRSYSSEGEEEDTDTEDDSELGWSEGKVDYAELGEWGWETSAVKRKRSISDWSEWVKERTLCWVENVEFKEGNNVED